MYFEIVFTYRSNRINIFQLSHPIKSEKLKLVIAFIYVFLDKSCLWRIFAYLLNLLRNMLRFKEYVYSKACSMFDTLIFFKRATRLMKKISLI